MLLRRLLHPSHHLRRGLQTLATTTNAAVAAPSSSSSPLSAPLPFRRLPGRFLSPRFLSTSGRDDDDTRNPWAFTTESGDPDPFADVDPAAATAGEAPLGSSAVVEDPWAKDFHADDSEKGDVFEEIYKDAAPTAREAAPAEGAEPWTIDFGDEKDDPFAAAVLDDGVVGIGDEAAEIEELVAGKDEDAERQLEEDKAREQQLMETLKGDSEMHRCTCAV
jgi:small subunit ribosomal protein S9